MFKTLTKHIYENRPSPDLMVGQNYVLYIKKGKKLNKLFLSGYSNIAVTVLIKDYYSIDSLFSVYLSVITRESSKWSFLVRNVSVLYNR